MNLEVDQSDQVTESPRKCAVLVHRAVPHSAADLATFEVLPFKAEVRAYAALLV